MNAVQTLRRHADYRHNTRKKYGGPEGTLRLRTDILRTIEKFGECTMTQIVTELHVVARRVYAELAWLEFHEDHVYNNYYPENRAPSEQYGFMLTASGRRVAWGLQSAA